MFILVDMYNKLWHIHHLPPPLGYGGSWGVSPQPKRSTSNILVKLHFLFALAVES
jgi:hypothetical protein